MLSAVKMDHPPVTADKDAILSGVPRSIAMFLVGQGLAEYIDPEGADAPGPTRAELEAKEAALANAKAAASAGTLQRMEFPDGKTAEPEGTVGEAPADEDPVVAVLEADTAADAETDDAPKRPYGNAPKSAWIRYGMSVDPELTEERGETMTKADLMSKYGERL